MTKKISGNITFYAEVPLEIYYRKNEEGISLLDIKWPDDKERRKVINSHMEEILEDILEDMRE